MRWIFHIDMNSYFASVEQQANPTLRGKPIVVSGKEGSRSVIVAASREAKKFGIKTAMLQHEARRLCPQLIFVEGDGAKYSYLSHEIFELFKEFTEKVEVYSIDEVFLDLSDCVQTKAQAVALASKIKIEINKRLGECITCSIGIAENKLLAKLASDLKKPDGLFFIDETNRAELLLTLKLTDLCGIGRRIEKRLEALGVMKMKHLQEYPLAGLIQEFGHHYGVKLQEMSHGLDNSEVVSFLFEPAAKSVGRSYTLARNTFDKEDILAVLMHLCEKVGRELRQEKLAGKTIAIYFRYADFTHYGWRKTLMGYTDDSLKIFAVAKNQIESFRFPKAVRLVGVHASNLVDGYNQLPLWLADRKRVKIIPYLDKINDTYGELTIKPAFLLKSKRLKKRVGGFKL
ncbi:MAG: DNA polymerase IV, partial [Patescibacteria group bacterium]